MFEKLDNFAIQWLETAKLGILPIEEAIQTISEFVFNIFWAIMALLLMVFTSPLWLLGKARVEHRV